MRKSNIRLAVRAVIVHDGRLLVVNAWKDRDHLWCAPGGGAELHASLPDNLAREVKEETGLEISVGEPCLVNEFHDPGGTFHQVDIYFRAALLGGASLDNAWIDPEGIVTKRRWVTKDEAAALLIKPDTLIEVAFDDKASAPRYDPLEPIVR